MSSEYNQGVIAPLDALLLKGDADPATRAIMSTALVLDRTPDFTRLTEAFERATHFVPRMRERVAQSSWARGQPRWVPDHHFAILDHVRHVGAPGDRSLEAVLAMASAAATAPFDPARPLWDAVLVTGLADGSAVVLLRAHHAIADGVRALQMMASLLDLEPDPARADLVTLEQRGSTLGRASTRRVREVSETVLARQLGAQALALAAFRSALRPVGSLTDAASYARSTIRTFGSRGATPSTLLHSRSRARTYGTLEFRLEDLRRCAKTGSATVNDVFLTGLLGGIRKYHEACGATVTDVPISFPIDVSGADNPGSGNHFSAAVIPGPSSVADPAARLLAVHELVASRRDEDGLDAPRRLAPLLHQLPSKLTATGLAAYARRIDMQASNIVGPDCAVYLAGAKVGRFYAFGPLPGIPFMAVLVSYEGTCTIGFTIDPAAVTDPELLLRSTRQSFEALLGEQTG